MPCGSLFPVHGGARAIRSLTLQQAPSGGNPVAVVTSKAVVSPYVQHSKNGERNLFHIGIDLAWANKHKKTTNESGIVMLGPTGSVVEAGWTVGPEETLDWLDRYAPPNAHLFVDAPLVVANATGQRLCEKQVGQRYWRWGVSANSTNCMSPHLAGVALRRKLALVGWSYHDGVGGPTVGPGRFVSECYPYTTIVGACELGYTTARPRYKRPPKGAKMAVFRPLRNAACDELIRRVARLKEADPPMNLDAHPDTRQLVIQKSPDRRSEYKHREDLLDAALCAWTAAFWSRWGNTRSQVLGDDDTPINGVRPTIIAPARSEQRP